MWKSIGGAAREAGKHPAAIQRAVKTGRIPVIGTKRKAVWMPAAKDFLLVSYLNPKLTRQLIFIGGGKAVIEGTSPPQVVHLFDEEDDEITIGISMKICARVSPGDVKWALSSLEDRDRWIVESRCGKNGRPTLEEIGRQLGISRERVRQIEERAVSKIQALLADKKIPFQSRPATKEEIYLLAGLSDWAPLSDRSLNADRTTLYILGKTKRIPAMRLGIWVVYKPAASDYVNYVAAVGKVPRLFLSAAPRLSFLGHGKVVYHQIAKSAAQKTNMWWESPEVLSNAFDMEDAIQQALSLAEEMCSTESCTQKILELAKLGSITSTEVSTTFGISRTKAWLFLSQMHRRGLLHKSPRQGKQAIRFSLKEYSLTDPDKAPG